MRDLPILYFSAPGECDRYIPRHTHRKLEWIWIRKGIFRAAFEGGLTLTAGPGDVFVIPPGIEHDQSEAPEGANIFALLEGFSGNIENAPQIIHTAGDPLCAQWFEMLPLLSREKSFSSEQGHFLRALQERLEHFASGERKKTSLHPGLLRAVNYIEENFVSDISIPELAAYANVSQSHLNLLFRKHFGCGAVSFIMKMRLEHARELLKNPYAAIAETARASGFEDANYFSRIFRKHYGITPGEYRSSAAGNA